MMLTLLPPKYPEEVTAAAQTVEEPQLCPLVQVIFPGNIGLEKFLAGSDNTRVVARRSQGFRQSLLNVTALHGENNCYESR